MIYSTLKGPVVTGGVDFECGGLTIDKFHNLFYVDTAKSRINKVNFDLLALDKHPVDIITTIYQGEDSKAARNVQDIAIEQEYLYWANDSQQDGHGGIHKAFTEPFIKPEPFQTYEIKDVNTASSITTNENYLFFIGKSTSTQGQVQEHNELYIQKKQGAGLYYHYNEAMTDRLLNPQALLTYKDTLLLVANEGFISILDISKFPPLSTDFKKDGITVTQKANPVANNSVCAAKRSAAAGPAPERLTPKDMSFISM